MASTQSPFPNLVFILNPAAGKGRGAAELVRLRHALSRRGLQADIFLTHSEGHAAHLVEGLSMPEGSVVFAVGGDGTVHEVGVALLERPECSLAVIPLGSGNDYAALMEVPRDPLQALDALLAGEDRRWDVGLVGPHSFLNTVGFGFSSKVSYYSQQTGPLRGVARYGLAVIRGFFAFRPSTITLDGLEISGRQSITLMEVGIGNRCGGGFRLTHEAIPDDGLLDVCIVRRMHRFQMPFLLPLAVGGKHIGHELVDYEKIPSFRLRLDSETMIHVDGEIRMLSRGEHTVRIRSKALKVRLPAGASLLKKPVES